MKKITISEVAKRAETSKTTVSFFLNGKTNKMSEDTRERIQRVIDETGYKPSAAARALKSKDNGVFGVILGDVSETASAQALKGIEEVANAVGYQLLLGNSYLDFNNEKEYIERMSGLGAEGFIIEATYRFGMLAITLEKRNKKLVYFGSKPYDVKGKCIKSDNYETVYAATAECLKKGYEEFILISDDPSVLSTGFENTKGYQDALQDSRKKAVSNYVTEQATSEGIYDFLCQNIKMDKKNLIYVASEKLLPVVFRAIKKFPDYQTLMPQTIGLIGFDNSGWTKTTTPMISVIMQPVYQEGQRAAEELIELLDGHQDDRKEILFKCAVKWRESTAT